MAGTATFDTLTTAWKLKAAGIDKAHAEAIAEAQIAPALTDLASKADIDRLHASLQVEIANRDNHLAWRLMATVGAAIVILLSAFGVAVAVMGNVFV